MSENLNQLHVMGVTGEGKVWHTLRSPGGWTPFQEVPPLGSTSGPAVDVACVRRLRRAPETAPATEGLWALIAYRDGPPQLRFRNADSGQWEGAVPATVLPLPVARRVAITVSRGVAAGGGQTRSYVHVAVIANGGVGDTGRIIAAIMPNDSYAGFASGLAEVQTSGAGDLGTAISVALGPDSDIAFPPGQESIAFLAATFGVDEGAMFFSRGGVSASSGTGSWKPFRAKDLRTPLGPGALPGRVLDVNLGAYGSVYAGNPDTGRYVVIAANFNGDSDVYGTRQNSADSTWRGWENYEVTTIASEAGKDQGYFRRISAAKTTEGLHVVGVTQEGTLLHELRKPANPEFVVFRDVELVGVGQDVGIFNAVTCG